MKLAEIDPASDGGINGKRVSALQLQKNLDRLAVLQHLLYAENRRRLLIVLQGIDAGGKDGTIRNVMTRRTGRQPHEMLLDRTHLSEADTQLRQIRNGSGI